MMCWLRDLIRYFRGSENRLHHVTPLKDSYNWDLESNRWIPIGRFVSQKNNKESHVDTLLPFEFYNTDEQYKERTSVSKYVEVW